MCIDEKKSKWLNIYGDVSDAMKGVPVRGYNPLDCADIVNFFWIVADNEYSAMLTKVIEDNFGLNNVEFVKTFAKSFLFSTDHSPTSNLDRLPEKRGIYCFFAFIPDYHNHSWTTDASPPNELYYGSVLSLPLYFGVSDNLRARFKNHHRMDEIRFLADVGVEIELHYFTDTEFYQLPDNLYALESRLISVFRPLLNNETRVQSPGKPTSQSVPNYCLTGF